MLIATVEFQGGRGPFNGKQQDWPRAERYKWRYNPLQTPISGRITMGSLGSNP